MQHDHRATSTIATKAPLWAVLVFTLIGSFGTGAVTNGVFFLAKSGYGFGRTRNALLGIALGATYILGAVTVGPALRRLAARAPWVSTRAVLVGVLIVVAAALLLPVAVSRHWSHAPEWTLWVLVCLFAPATGAMWPIVESYLSGGRRGAGLRRVISRFNLVWSGAVAVALWGMAPVWDSRPLVVLTALGVFHFLAIGCVIPMGREPGRHLSDDHGPAPASYRELLLLFRGLLAASYLFLSALGPTLPTILERLAITEAWQTPTSSVWQVARVAVFFVLGLAHGWHGRRWPAWLAATGLVAGFALASSSPLIAGWWPGAGLPAIGLGLALFGSSMAMVYKASLYYAMETGSAEVDAGGAHEALIGLGYTLGPVLTLLASLAISYKYLPESSFGPVMTIGASVLAAGLAGGFVVLGKRRSSSRGQPNDR